MWPSTWHFGEFQNINVYNNETHIINTEVMNRSCTSQLLLQYLDKASILQACLKACKVERTGDWTTQMIELWRMSPWPQPLSEIVKSLYAEGGSSVRRASQLYKHYLCGCHVIRRSNWILGWPATCIWSGCREGEAWRRLVVCVRQSYWYRCSIYYQTWEQYIEPLHESIRYVIKTRKLIDTKHPICWSPLQ